MSLLHQIDAIYVINLPHRADRRAEIDAQLARARMSLSHPKVHLFEAVRPQDPGGFPSIGARGCFLSHLGVLKDAAARGLETVLILEDDADFLPALVAPTPHPKVAQAARAAGLFYLGYDIPPGCHLPAGSPVVELPAGTGLRQTHSMVVSNAAIVALIPYFETMLARPPGHPDGGPMHVDGAYSWFRKDHPDFLYAAAQPPLAIQRASQTDIHAPGWKDRIPMIAILRRLQNRIRAWRQT